MFGVALKLILLSVLAAPQLLVEWVDKHHESVKIQVVGGEEFVEPCLKGGLGVSYRYTIELCEYNAMWRDPCEESRTAIHNLNYDPISDKYIANQDLLRDDQPRTESSLTELDEALRYLTRIEQLALRVLKGDRAPFSPAAKDYLSLTVSAWCEGEYNRTLARISSVLTLGIFGSTEFDTGWTAFPLK